MKTVLVSVLICCFFAPLAVAEDGSTAAGADPAGPVALTEAQMDEVTAGEDYSNDFTLSLDEADLSGPIKIPASKRAKFKPGKALSDALN